MSTQDERELRRTVLAAVAVETNRVVEKVEAAGVPRPSEMIPTADGGWRERPQR
jgi:hypothetical protein